MKNLFKSIFILLFAFSLSNADVISQSGQKDGFDVKIKSEKSLVVGNNTFFVELLKDGKAVTSAKVKLKFFMPEMPGMPYMEYEDEATLVDGKYKVNINLSMGGTWQYMIKFKAEDGTVHSIKSSVNL